MKEQVTEVYFFLIRCLLAIESFKLEDLRSSKTFLSLLEEDDNLSYETNKFNTKTSQQMTRMSV